MTNSTSNTMGLFHMSKYYKNRVMEKLWRTQERLIRQSNEAWSMGVRSEYKRHKTIVQTMYYKRCDRLLEMARSAHKALICLNPALGWSVP